MPTVAPPPVELITERLASIRSLIAAVDRGWTHPVEIVAVTKGFDADAIVSAAAAGCDWIGENYAQELLGKRAEVKQCAVRLQFIGRLQSNKVRQLAGVVDLWSSVDRPSLVTEIARRAPGAPILIQVNSTGEDTKSGCAPRDVVGLVRSATAEGLAVEGLMTIGPTNGDPAATAAGFELTRRLVDDNGLHECSMGMSADLELAVRHGATQVRLGTALFGQRPGVRVGSQTFD